MSTVVEGTGVQAAVVLTPADLLEHWQGHRNLTRRVIEAFPEDQLFSFTIGSMRPFGNMVVELLVMGAPTARGGADDVWEWQGHDWEASKEELLEKWDQATRDIEEHWARIRPERFQEQVIAFGEYPGKFIETVQYVIDNEIHHRGQGYVYLRALEIEPPHFWER
jgi:uncharacterized damage-inducible protein DinB